MINTSSTSGLFSNPGQTNYGAAKSGIATFGEIAAKELARYGVRVNSIAPAARTRLTLATPGIGEQLAQEVDPSKFDEWDPANISPLVAWLGAAACKTTGKTFYVQGGRVGVFKSWHIEKDIDKHDRWDVTELGASLDKLLES